MSRSAIRHSKKSTNRNIDKHFQKELRGTEQESNVYLVKAQKYDLSWFHPLGKQVDVVNAMDTHNWVVIQGKSGVGKTSTVVWKSLSLLQENKYRKIVFIKNATESGDDMIGFLTGNEESKLEAHFDSMRGVFMDFMSKPKLECDEKNENIKFTIPNFLLGKTFSNSIVILEEAQTYSPKTMKLLMERVDDSCKLICLGDYQQRYSVKQRDDGFSDLIRKVTTIQDGVRVSKEPLIQYVEIPASENRRGEISQRVTELYEDVFV